MRRFLSYALKGFIYCFLCLALSIGIGTTGALAWDVSLAWDANSESDLAGYRLYQKVGPDESMVDVGNVTTHTVQGLGDGTYTWWLTAYDTSDNESSPSNTVSKTLAEPVINLPPSCPGGVTVIVIVK